MRSKRYFRFKFKSVAYILIMRNQIVRRIKIGRLGKREFPAGIYLYVGSGGANVLKRAQRHLTYSKRIRWHIDYLTTGRKRMKPIDVYFFPVASECGLAFELGARLQAVGGFGCSDCRCRSHLFFAADWESVEGSLADLQNRFCL